MNQKLNDTLSVVHGTHKFIIFQSCFWLNRTLLLWYYETHATNRFLGRKLIRSDIVRFLGAFHRLSCSISKIASSKDREEEDEQKIKDKKKKNNLNDKRK